MVPVFDFVTPYPVEYGGQVTFDQERDAYQALSIRMWNDSLARRGRRPMPSDTFNVTSRLARFLEFVDIRQPEGPPRKTLEQVRAETRAEEDRRAFEAMDMMHKLRRDNGD